MLDAITAGCRAIPAESVDSRSVIAAGNYYWVLLDRPAPPTIIVAPLMHFLPVRMPVAAWRYTWAAYMDRKPESGPLLEAFIRKYPTDNAVPDALYWLGRSAERAGNLPLARSFYVKGSQASHKHFSDCAPPTKLPRLALNRLKPAEIIAAIPDAPPIGALDSPIPPEVEPRWMRATALRLIGFDANAELELRTAYGIHRAALAFGSCAIR